MSELNRQMFRSYIREVADKSQPNSNTGVQGLTLVALSLLLEDRCDMFSDVVDFHRKFKVHYDGPVRMLEGDQLKHRNQTIQEEVDEYFEAQDMYNMSQTDEERQQALEDMMDALADLIYFALGTAHLQGFHRFNEAWKRIHQANMAKELSSHENPGKRSEAGGNFVGLDIVKPKGWAPAKLRDLLS